MPEYNRKPAWGTHAREDHDARERRRRAARCPCGSGFRPTLGGQCTACDPLTRDAYRKFVALQKEHTP